MLCMLLAYDASGNIVGTLDHLVQYDVDGNALGLVDFDVHELAGGDMTDVWNVSNAVGSKTWPEWLGSAVHQFKVELTGPSGAKRITGLIHNTSGYKRKRSDVEKAIDDRVKAKVTDEPVDIRDLVGGPSRPLLLDADGKTKARVAVVSTLPIVKVKP